jgi:hypothetical protein
MAEVGRGNKTPKSTEMELFRLYVLRSRENDEQFLFSVQEIAEILDICPKTARKILRDRLVQLLRRHVLRRR